MTQDSNSSGPPDFERSIQPGSPRTWSIHAVTKVMAADEADVNSFTDEVLKVFGAVITEVTAQLFDGRVEVVGVGIQHDEIQ